MVRKANVLGEKEAERLFIESIIDELATEIEWIGYLKGLRFRKPGLSRVIDPVLADLEKVVCKIQGVLDDETRKTNRH